MSHGWFVTGTDTGIGKTRVAEALVQALAGRGRAVGMKPVASGCRHTPAGLRNDDAERLQAASSVAVAYADVNPYAFEPAIAPHAAAAQAGVEMQLETIDQSYARLKRLAEWVVVEGAGGWRVPLNREHYLSDVARRLRLPVLIVVGVRLGCISHALLTAEAVARDGMALAGWVANCIDPHFTADASIAALSDRLGRPLVVAPYDAAGSGACAVGESLALHLLG
jgi:dethiobiotin synthetase